jgi:hypothetical protein
MIPEHPPGSLIVGVINKKSPEDKAGLHLEVRHGRIYVSKLTDAILKNPVNSVRAGDELFELQGKTVDKYKGGIKEMRKVIEEEAQIVVLVQRPDPDASSVSTDSDLEDDDDHKKETQGRNKKKADEVIPHTIEIGAMYQLRRLTNRELNGSLVRVLHEDSNQEGRWKVKLIETRTKKIDTIEVISVATEKLFRIIRVGDTMKLRDLKSKPELNGSFVKVKELVSKERARWLVDVIESGTSVSVAAKNLEHM